MLSLLTAAVLFAAPLSDPPLVEADVPSAPTERPQHLGLAFSVGLPQGAGAGLTFGPARWLKLEAGAAHNGMTAGFQGGVTLVPFSWLLRPTLSAHGGMFPTGNSEPLVRFFTGNPDFSSTLLERVRYDFLSAELGLEIGRRSGTSFFLRAGVCRTFAHFESFEDAAREVTGDPALSASAPALVLTTPTAQLGLSITLL